MSDASDERLARIEQGLNALFAAEIVEEILAAVDFEAILADAPAEDPVDVERLASTLGRPLGRALAAKFVDDAGAAGILTRIVVSEFTGRVASRALEMATENLDGEARAVAPDSGWVADDDDGWTDIAVTGTEDDDTGPGGDGTAGHDDDNSFDADGEEN